MAFLLDLVEMMLLRTADDGGRSNLRTKVWSHRKRVLKDLPKSDEVHLGSSRET